MRFSCVIYEIQKYFKIPFLKLILASYSVFYKYYVTSSASKSKNLKSHSYINFLHTLYIKVQIPGLWEASTRPLQTPRLKRKNFTRIPVPALMAASCLSYTPATNQPPKWNGVFLYVPIFSFTVWLPINIKDACSSPFILAATGIFYVVLRMCPI